MARSHPILPFLAVAAGIASFSVTDATMKAASIEAGVYSALLLRCAGTALLMLPVWAWSSPRWPGREAMKVHVLRSSVAAVMTMLFFWALVRLPIAESIAISFIAPLIALYLASVLLGELIQPKAVIASLLGLGGVLVIGAARFGSGAMDASAGWGIAAILCSAMLYAYNLILQRRQAQAASPQEIALFQNLIVTAILSCAAPWFAEWPSAAALRDIAISSVLTGISLMLLAWGYARAETQALVPVEYTGFIWASLMGWLMFGETVTWTTLVGVVLIVIGCWIAARRPTEMTAL